MLKKLLALLLSVSLLLGAAGCARPAKEEPRLRVVASFYPIYIMGLNITDGVPGVELSNMAGQQTGCLHDFQMQTDDMKNLESADAFLINGAGMESFLDKVVDELPDLMVIDSSTGIPLLESGAEEGHHHSHEDGEHGHDHEDNPHLWVSVDNCIQQVKNLAEGLAELDPDYADAYRQNADEYVGKLTALRDKMHEELSDLSTRDIITFHEAFPYFADEFDLHIVAVINREPESEPSARELADIIRLVRQTGVRALFVEPQYSRTAADIVQAETDAKVYVLDPGVSGEEDKDAYLNIMEQNLQTLLEALK